MGDTQDTKSPSDEAKTSTEATDPTMDLAEPSEERLLSPVQT